MAAEQDMEVQDELARGTPSYMLNTRRACA